MKYLAPLLVIVGIVVAAILLKPEGEATELTPTRTRSATTHNVPPVDADAPTATETATFALG